MQGREKCCLRSLLIHRAASDDYFAQWRFVHDSRFSRRRRPFRRIELFHVIHEIEPNRFLRAGFERREHARFPISIDHRRLLKSRVARQLRHVIRAFGITAVLGGDRHLRNPILQPLHGFVVAFCNFGFDVRVIVLSSITDFNCCELNDEDNDREVLA